MQVNYNTISDLKYLCELFPEVFPYHDDDGKWINSQLMNMAFRKKDFNAANKYAKLCGAKSIKCKCAKTRLTFYLFVLLKEIKAMVKKIISKPLVMIWSKL